MEISEAISRKAQAELSRRNWHQDLANRYGGLPFLPLTLLIDRNGTIAESHPGVVDKQAFENKIKALLQESPAR
jgi:hypothetical protein